MSGGAGAEGVRVGRPGPGGPPEFRGRLLGAALAGGLLAGLAVIAIGFGVARAAPGAGAAVRAFLSGGGWWIALLCGAALGALRASR